MSKKYHLILVFLICVIAYSNALRGGFIWDDKHLIAENYYIKYWHNLSTNFTSDFFSSSQDEEKIGYYRPIITLSYMLDYTLWKLNPFGYHLTNLIVHLLNGMLIYFILTLLFKNTPVALLASLLFISHPVHTESVSWIAGRTDLIAAFFFFLSFYLYIKGTLTHRLNLYILPSLTSFFLCLLSKEIAIVLPFIFVLYDYTITAKQQCQPLTPRIKYWLLYLSTTLLYLICRFVILDIETGNPHVSAFGTTTIMLTFVKAMSYYCKKLFFPVNLNSYVMISLIHATFLKVLCALAIAGFLVWLAIACRQKSYAVSFGIFFFLITLIPLTNLVPINAPHDIDFPLAERFLYIPSFALCYLGGIGLNSLLYRFRSKKNLRIITIAAIGLLLASTILSTIIRNKDWKNELTLYLKMVKASPNSYILHNNLGTIYSMNEDYQKAHNEYRQALMINPDHHLTHNNLANDYRNRGLNDKAMESYLTALRLYPNYPEAHNNLGILYKNKGLNKEAMEEYKKSLRIKPHYAQPHYNIGLLFDLEGNYDSAMGKYKQALEIYPEYPKAHNNLGNIYSRREMTQEALHHYKKALDGEPDFFDAHFNLGLTLSKQKQHTEAITHFRKAATLEPELAEVHALLASALEQNGNFKEAIKEYETILTLKPADPQSHFHLGVIYLYAIKDSPKAAYHFKKAYEFDPTLPRPEEVENLLTQTP